MTKVYISAWPTMRWVTGTHQKHEADALGERFDVLEGQLDRLRTGGVLEVPEGRADVDPWCTRFEEGVDALEVLNDIPRGIDEEAGHDAVPAFCSTKARSQRKFSRVAEAESGTSLMTVDILERSGGEREIAFAGLNRARQNVGEVDGGQEVRSCAGVRERVQVRV